MFLYGFFQHRLAGTGTHVFINGAEFNTFKFTCCFGNFLAIDRG
jgi:hypothetical protein